MIPHNETDSQKREKVLELQNRLDQTSLQLNDLATMGALITSIMDLEVILSVVMEMSIRLIDAEVGLIQLEENNKLAHGVAWGIDDSIVKNFIYRDDLDIAEYCFVNQESILLSQDNHDLKFGPNITCLMALPIQSREKCHGVIVVINKSTGEAFTDKDKKNLEMLVNFASVAIDNAALLKEALQKQKFEQELAIAKQIQQAILPDNKVKIAGVDVGIFYRPARYVSGDFYDIIKITDTDFLMVVGDVSNKGVPAAMVMSATTAIIRSELMRSSDIKPSQLVYNLNNVLCNGVIKENDMFATLFIARINIDEMIITYCNAGHNPPLFQSAETGDVLELPAGGTFVGQFADISYIDGERKIKKGDRLLAYTDGITEAENINKEQFGTERLTKAFVDRAEMSADSFCERTVQWLDRFTEGASEEPFDDITLLEVIILQDRDGKTAV